jgi:hypothetical protein
VSHSLTCPTRLPVTLPYGLYKKIDFSKVERKITSVKEEETKETNSTP